MHLRVMKKCRASVAEEIIAQGAGHGEVDVAKLNKFWRTSTLEDVRRS